MVLRSRCVDSRSRVSCAAARMGTAAARRRIRWSRFSSSRCSALGGQRGIGGPLVYGGGRRGGGGDHRMDFCPPASSLLRRRLLPRLREACEVGSRSSSSFVFSAGDGGVVATAFPRSLAVRSFTIPSSVDGLLDGVRSEDGGGPGGCIWRVGEGSVGLLRGWLDPEQTELGARRRPIWLHRLLPSR